MKQMIERLLRKVFGAEARDPDPAVMNAMEQAESASAMRGSGADLRSDFASSVDAQLLAADASQHGHVMQDRLVDDSEEAAALARSASEHDGSHLQSELDEDNEDADTEAELASHIVDMPRSELVDDSDGAREAAERVSKTPDKPDDSEGEKGNA